eukprot:175548_1
MTLSIPLEQFETALPKLVHTILTYSRHYCTHIDGEQTNNKQAANAAVEIERIGSLSSAVKTYYNYISNVDGAQLLAGTAHCLRYEQIQYLIRAERLKESHMFCVVKWMIILRI